MGVRANDGSRAAGSAPDTAATAGAGAPGPADVPGPEGVPGPDDAPDTVGTAPAGDGTADGARATDDEGAADGAGATGGAGTAEAGGDADTASPRAPGSAPSTAVGAAGDVVAGAVAVSGRPARRPQAPQPSRSPQSPAPDRARAASTPRTPDPAGEPAPDGAEEESAGGTRRPPAVTEGTVRPEGGGRAAPGDAPAPARQWPLLTVLGITALGLVVIGFDAFRHAPRIGALLIGVALLTGAGLRRALPSVGMLAVRSRFTDMITYGVLGGAIVLFALMTQPDPWLEIPFLKEAVRFTVR
ncbi:MULTISPECIES: DUF3017 domain-containing protein [Streptomyces]|uniref:DUF3017 domain-containing protein n=1 Tax=Streptomyces changanensis TaxID=2964669 RepID=A0ABY5N9A3_9ACTN|nr:MULTISPECIES: DUF3017 domain-containing protein [Streptomyces]UUS32599.1 DUF3017 domain-containing protein [Streptomyces changanensis]